MLSYRFDVAMPAISASVVSLLIKFLLFLLTFFLTYLFALSLGIYLFLCTCFAVVLAFFVLLSFSYFHKCL